MCMSVVNVKVKYIRPAYKDLAEWCNDPTNIYIGRAGIVFIDGERYPKISSPFANPFKIGRDGSREEVLQKYQKWLEEKMRSPQFLTHLKELKGKTLGCWCAPEGCHGDILLEVIEKL